MTLIENLSGKPEQFGLDLHSLSLENVFVDSNDHSKIVSLLVTPVISPDYICRHEQSIGSRVPFARYGSVSAFQLFFSLAHSWLAQHFREAVKRIAGHSPPALQHILRTSRSEVSALATEWFHYEAVGAYLRHAH